MLVRVSCPLQLAVLFRRLCTFMGSNTNHEKHEDGQYTSGRRNYLGMPVIR